MSHYDWNTNLNLPILDHARAVKADLVTVLGGPNFHAGDNAWVTEFFTCWPAIDAYITGEGEHSFSLLVHLIDRYGSVAKVPVDERPSTIYAFDHREGQVVHNPGLPVARLDLRTVPSP